MLAVEVVGVPDGPPIDVAFEVQPGQCLALAGPSGAGKTTILRMIAGLAAVGGGRISLGSRTLTDVRSGVLLPPEERGCGMVFQDYALFRSKNAWRNVAYPLGGSRSWRHDRAVELLGRFGVDHLAEASIDSLSGGERQRVALARAIACDPDVLLLDEPLAALDVRTRAQAAAELAALVRDLELPALLVTHQFFDAALLGQEIAVIEQGEIVQRGTAPELAAQPASAFVADFTGANVLSGFASAAPDGLTRVELSGGGQLLSTDSAAGAVATSIQPWEITLEPAGAAVSGSARNVLEATVSSIAPVGGRLRVGLALPQPLAVDLTDQARQQLALKPGVAVQAVFKASATRLYPHT